ncbi:MAG: DEAD/DEAH box helicase family protein, partial [Bacteroidaceae bacterium]|nr:DEAD/DEAH box helicase family protein [Bacteroidaceae bacterium]
MLNKRKYQPIYRTHKDSIDQDFYVPCFSESIRLDRAAGYFSLHSLTLSIDGIIRFVRKGGQINLICSPDISQEDAELIDACVSLDKEHITKSLLEEIIDKKLSDEELAQLDIICNMLSEGKMTIKIAYQPLGIFHEKFGIFIDESDNKVYFNGSLNETKRAFVHNQESIRVNYSWQSAFTSQFIDSEQRYFDSLWNDQEESVVVIDFPEAVEKELLNYYKRSETLEAAIDNYISSHITKGKKTLYSYQEDAIKQFCENGYQHFYEMATGTGKTFTSVKTIQTLEKKCEENLFVVVCVPQ